MTEQTLLHSEYIYSAVKKFDLISSEARKPLSKHKVFEFEKVEIKSNSRAADEFEYDGHKVYYKDGHYIDNILKVIK